MIPSELKKHKILISCLNWGKGHVARCIGLIEELISQENEIVIAGNSDQLQIFNTYFPTIECVEIPAYPFRFAGNGNFSSDLWKSRKSLYLKMKAESILVEKLVKGHSISLVLSDHRYGFYAQSVPSIFITHQLNLALKWWQFSAQLIHEKFMRKFQTIWVMDSDDSALAGQLSWRKNRQNVVYIGHYSRFMHSEKMNNDALKIVVCNGPTPYDEQLLMKYIDNSEFQLIAPIHLKLKYPHAAILPSNDWRKCDELILKANEIHAYCGYSTLMDAKYLTATFNLIPTKGQLEQEYLYSLHYGSNK